MQHNSNNDQQPKQPSRRKLIRNLAIGGTVLAIGGGITAYAVQPDPLVTYSGHTTFPFSKHSVKTIAWSPNGKLIASGDDNKELHVWDAATGSSKYLYKGYTAGIVTLVWSPDGTRIATSSLDNTLHMWNTNTLNKSFAIREKARIRGLAWSPNGTHIAAGCFGVTIFKVVTESMLTPIIRYGTNIYVSSTSLSWSPNSQRIVADTESNVMQIWDLPSKKLRATYNTHKATINSVAWSPSGRHIASGSADNTAIIWDTLTNQPITIYTEHSAPVTATAWSPNSKLIATASVDQTVRIWHPITKKTIFSHHGHSQPVNTLAWSPDGTRIASGSQDGTVQIWQVL